MSDGSTEKNDSKKNSLSNPPHVRASGHTCTDRPDIPCDMCLSAGSREQRMKILAEFEKAISKA